MSTTTRRHPRTLQEAFGPYCGHEVAEPARPMHRHDRIVFKASLLASVILFGLIATGVVL